MVGRGSNVDTEILTAEPPMTSRLPSPSTSAITADAAAVTARRQTEHRCAEREPNDQCHGPHAAPPCSWATDSEWMRAVTATRMTGRLDGCQVERHPVVVFFVLFIPILIFIFFFVVVVTATIRVFVFVFVFIVLIVVVFWRKLGRSHPLPKVHRFDPVAAHEPQYRTFLKNTRLLDRAGRRPPCSPEWATDGPRKRGGLPNLLKYCDPDGTRTRAAGVKGRCPNH
jgi:hypothetical protein